ncbi:hypothetical protein [Microcoleus sp. AT3-D2]|uniref:hypothetical protein n=1 Tax=Microcoleus sp. AT3-D2 TaxID=2818612 RepID=UPI002FD79855
MKNATNNASWGNQNTAILTIVDTTPTPTPTPTGTPAPAPNWIGDRIERPNLDRPNPVDNIINGNSGILIGTSKNDGYLGSNSPNIFDVKAGKDNLIGGNSPDIFNGKEGNDSINGKNGNDFI